jgi:hypothetical protein
MINYKRILTLLNNFKHRRNKQSIKRLISKMINLIKFKNKI